MLAWEPPDRLVLAWRIGADWRFDPSLLTEVEVRFRRADASSTRVELEHRLLENMGGAAEAARASFQFEQGWSGVLASYAAAAADSHPRRRSGRGRETCERAAGDLQRGHGPVGLTLLEVAGLAHLVRDVREAQHRLSPRLSERVERCGFHLDSQDALSARGLDAGVVSRYGASIVQDAPRSTGSSDAGQCVGHRRD